MRATRAARYRFTPGAAAAAVLAACLISACGEDSKGELSQRRASDLRSALSDVEARVQARDCTGAAQQASAFREQVGALPARVDRDLRDALDASASRLESLVSRECRPEPAAPVQEAPVQEPTTTDENTGDQQDQSKQDKKPKKEKKPKDDQPPPDESGGSGGSTGVTGPDEGTLPPEGG